MTYVIAEPCVDTMDQACVAVCPVDCIHFEQGVDRTLYIDPERVHRLRRLRARVPGERDLPRGVAARRSGPSTRRSTRSGSPTRTPRAPWSRLPSPPDAAAGRPHRAPPSSHLATGPRSRTAGRSISGPGAPSRCASSRSCPPRPRSSGPSGSRTTWWAISHACDYPPGVAGRPVVTSADAASGAPGPPRARAGRRGGRGDARPWSPSTASARLAPAGPPAGRRPPRPAARATPTGCGPPSAPTRASSRSSPSSLEGIFHAIATVGAMTDAEDEAVGLVEILRERLADVEEVVEERRDEGHHAPRVVALDWLDPLSSAGLWVPEQIRRAGGWEVLGERRRAQRADDLGGRRRRRPRDAAPGAVRDAPRARRSAPGAPRHGRRTGPRSRPSAGARCSPSTRRPTSAGPGPRVIDGIELLAEIFDPAAFVDLAPAGSWVPVQ